MKRYLPFILGTGLGMLMAVVFSVGRASAATGCFTDTNGHLFETFICWLKDNGISTGYGDGTYGPEDYVTRGQMAVFLERVAALTRGTGTQFDSTLFSPSVDPDESVTFMSVNITAPSAGALLVNGTLNLYCNVGLFSPCNQSSGNTYVNVDGTLYNRLYYAIDGGDNQANDGAWNANNAAYIPVAAGAHTVGIQVVNSSASAGATGVWSGGINVLFVKFDGAGTMTMPEAVDYGAAPEPQQGQPGQ